MKTIINNELNELKYTTLHSALDLKKKTTANLQPKLIEIDNVVLFRKLSAWHTYDTLRQYQRQISNFILYYIDKSWLRFNYEGI